jgi:hypothetical protein
MRDRRKTANRHAIIKASALFCDHLFAEGIPHGSRDPGIGADIVLERAL